MTKAVFRKKEGLYINFEVNGHASYADSGNDLVCAGISTAVIMSINLLDKLIPDLFEVIQDDAVGYICLKNIEYSKMSAYDISIVTKIIDNLIETLESIQANYQNHLKVKIEN